MKTAKPTMPCSACHGTGKVPLPPIMSETLDALRARPMTAPELFAKMGAVGSPTAANGRLEALRRLGLVARERRGRKTYTYRCA